MQSREAAITLLSKKFSTEDAKKIEKKIHKKIASIFEQAENHCNSSIPWFARPSAISFSRWPLWPFTKCHSTSWPCTKLSSACHKSAFFTGWRLAVRQPLCFQLASHSVIPFRTYCESVVRVTRLGRFNAANP